MNAWSHLPNAAYIDRILESLKTHNDIWTETYDGTRIQAQDAAWDAAWDAARDAAVAAAWNAAWGAAVAAAVDAAVDAARDAILALIAWDDSSQFLEMTGDALEVYARLSDDPRATLLLPAVRAFERIKELETL